MTGLGNSEQVRAIVEQVVSATMSHVDQKIDVALASKGAAVAEVPAPLKWASGIVAAIATAGFVGICVWLVTTLSEMQQTVTRIDERQQLQGANVDDRFSDFDRRVSRLESAHGVPR